MFNTASISMAFDPDIEGVSRAGVFHGVRVTDGKRGIVNVVFPAEFGEERASDILVCRRFELCVASLARPGTDRRVLPLFFSVELNHGFVDRNVIRTPSIYGL